MSVKITAAPVLALANTKPRMAKRMARNVDVDAAREGDSGGREMNNAYDPNENLEKRVFK